VTNSNNSLVLTFSSSTSFDCKNTETHISGTSQLETNRILYVI